MGFNKRGLICCLHRYGVPICNHEAHRAPAPEENFFVMNYFTQIGCKSSGDGACRQCFT